MIRHLALTLITCVALAEAAVAQTNPSAAAIRDRMRLLSDIVGCWQARTEVRTPAGVVPEAGTYDIRWILDSTYIQIGIDLQPSNGGPRRRLLSLVTFDAAAKRYRQTYFYAGTATQVSETGDWSAADRAYRTTTVIPRMDGKRDFHIRTEMRPFADSVSYLHYSRYADEANEQLELKGRLIRAAPGICT